jgi:hypothetical protein
MRRRTEPGAAGGGTPGRQSRRRFIKLIAAGSAAMLAGTGSAARGQAAVKPAPRAAARALTPAVRAEILEQQQYLAQSLKAIREYTLPPGSEMACGFEPLKARAGARKRGAAGGNPR